MKKILYIPILLLVCFFLVINQLFSVEDKITLAKTGLRKPVIIFNHKAHTEIFEIKCISCHHKGMNYKCSRCHTRRDRGKVINIKGAFHQQCRDCHRKTLGPKACSRCHKELKRKLLR